MFAGGSGVKRSRQVLHEEFSATWPHAALHIRAAPEEPGVSPTPWVRISVQR
jgi:hypothetical protein